MLPVVALLTLLAVAAAAVTLGQLDDFQDGTTQGWGSGAVNPNPPIHVADVGPSGTGDDSLEIRSTGGFGAGSKFTAFNETQWTGDFTTAGVDRIDLDVNNIGAVTLNLRIALTGPGGPFATTASVPVLVGSGWQNIGLLLGPADLTSVGGTDVNATLAAVGQLRLISAASPSFQGDTIVALGWIDNVMANSQATADAPALPAPAWVLLALLLAALATAGPFARPEPARRADSSPS